MNSQEKKIDLVSTIFLVLVALANDAATLISLLLAATGIGIAAQAVMQPIDFLIDAGVTSFFLWRAGMGWPTIVQFIADILESFGVPGRTISVGIGIYLANRPASIVGKFAQKAVSVESKLEGDVTQEAGLQEKLREETHVQIDQNKQSPQSQEANAGAVSGTKQGTREAPTEEDQPEEDLAKKEHDEEIERSLEGETQEDPIEVARRHEIEEPVTEDPFKKSEEDQSAQNDIKEAA